MLGADEARININAWYVDLASVPAAPVAPSCKYKSGTPQVKLESVPVPPAALVAVLKEI